ncbi:MAG: rhomboid family intramembrane serine protease [Polaribacter sp.]|jgi:membrane associated rhomboid family serine protease|uniref:rhomboid family intramembrane serine protease n=1 Tax=Polaribacter sp. TaxID=1920175 RepID=UPI0026329630|nr:rhomboid family intramembrane serine protease [Polaribacter sp.]MBT4414196.1 rhomboid family intramembrane serine protease [Polaribacter sp.]MDG1194159.1 rhomboid family intramembrane serine protease [Polaribacter sp.]MDG1402888.1 rhomboid family intramembrane serine protease [Polaribacter sp.]MDG2436422.1 rhomboid family intramembrane serine protease [Polaribacter sp.]
MNRLTDAIKHLIIINVILFVVPQLLQLDLTNILALHFPKNEYFGFWQYITHMFMHGSFPHILFNMYGLYAFGTPLEQIWGKNKFIFFYFSAGLGAGIIYSLVNYYQFNGVYELFINAGLNDSEVLSILKSGSTNDVRVINAISQEQFNKITSLYSTPAVGASGAVYGVLVAFGLYFKDAKLALLFFPVPIAAKYFIPVMILGDLFFGMTKYSVGNIAHFAHIGGALIGFIIAWYWKNNQFKVRQ